MPTIARSRLASLLVLALPGLAVAVDVLTQHNDNARTGANTAETILTTANVNQATFGKAFSYTVNGNVYAQPLYVSQYPFGGTVGTRNAVIIATENNAVYAFDADNRPVTGSSPLIWTVNLGTAATNGNGGCGDLTPNVGITGTPVIDKANGVIYLVSKTNTGAYANKLHALSLVDGSAKPNSPVTIAGSFPKTTSGTTTFGSQYQFNRPGLLLANGRVYAAFGSHCDQGPYQGWIFGYTTADLTAAPSVYCTSPDGGLGAIWQSGNGLVADAANNIYCATGNGGFNGAGTAGDKGMALLKLSSTLALGDFFINKDAATQSSGDADFGSGGPLLIPGTTRLVMAGKPGIVYLCDTGGLGGFSASADGCAQVISGANSLQDGSDGNAQCPVYWSGPGGPTVYYFAGRNSGNFARAYHYNTGTSLLDAAPVSTSTITQGGRAGGSSLSASGATNGILWTIKSDSGGNSPPGPGRLMALDATNLTTLLWDSQQNAARDSLGNYAKLSYPTIANGRVYAPTLNASDGTNTVCVYGLLAQRIPTSLAFLTQPAAANAGATMGSVQVEVLDQYGQLLPTATSPVTLAIGANPGSGTLAGTLTVSAVNGVATFSNLNINNSGAGYTLVATSTFGGFTTDADIPTPTGGDPAIAGSSATVSGGYDVVGGGSDITNTADHFHFAYRQVSGDFDLSTRIQSITPGNNAQDYTKSGLMARSSLSSSASNVMAIVFPGDAARNLNSGGYEYQFRDTNGGGTTPKHPADFTPNTPISVGATEGNAWVRLKKVGSAFTAYWSTDGVTWTSYITTSSTSMPDPFYIGLAECAHDNTKTATGRYRNLALNGVYHLDAATSSAFTINSAGFVAAPVITPPTGSYSGPVTATITESDGAAVIHYTINGTTPSASSPTIGSGGTLPFSATTTVKAIAIKVGSSSAVTTAVLTITGGTPYGMAARGALPALSIPAAGATATTTLSATGLFANTSNLTPSSGVVPYTVNSPLWSDRALKRRWVALPNGASIGFAATGEWTWPTGTVLVKHFELDTGSGIRRLETRVTVITGASAGYGLTYKWRSDNSDADLIASAGLDEAIPVSGGSQTWHYPSRSECLQCHTGNAGFVLGPKTRQLNGTYAYPGGASDNQLRTWNYLQMFSSDIGESGIPAQSRSVSILDGTANLENRVKSYLDSNCGQCHRPGGASGTNWDARYDTPLASMGLINADPLKGNLGVVGAKLVLPSDVPRSILSLRMHSTDNLTKMPPLARNLVDDQAVAVVDQWIGGGAVDQAGQAADTGGSSSKKCGMGGLFATLALVLYGVMRSARLRHPTPRERRHRWRA